MRLSLPARWTRRQTGLAASVTVPVLVGVLALTHEGFPIAQLDLDDGGVWLTSQTDLALGRFNVPVGELDGGLGATSADLDVLQDGQDVLLLEGAQVSRVDAATVTVTDRATVVAGATVQLAQGTVAVDDGQGQVWIRSLADLAQLGQEVPADLDVGQGGRAVVASDGQVLAVRADGRTSVVGVDGQVRTADSLEHAPTSIDQLTAVGDEPVVLDGSTVITRAGSVTLPSADLVLQAPGAAASDVVVAGADALYEVPLRGGDPVARPTGSTGTPARPVQVAGCSYGAWAATTGNWMRVCDGVVDSTDRAEISATDTLVFRVNRSQVVLNDVVAGRAWMADDPAATIPDWDTVQPQPDEQPDEDQGTEQTQEQTTRCSEEGNPPMAADDDYGVRPGRPTVLRVLANDSTSDCGILVISAVDDIPAAFGSVRTVDDGRALQVDVAPGATGTVTFTYTVTDRPGARAPATATVRLTAHPMSQNSPPVQVQATSMSVGQGGSVSAAVLQSFIDPDGDPLTLVGASLDPAFGSVSFRPDGVVTVVAGAQVGTTSGTVLVSDQIADPVEGTLDVSVLEGSASPVIDPVHAVGFVNQLVVIDALAAVRSSGQEAPRLAGVGEATGTTVVPDLAAGTFTVVAARPGAYYVSFTVVSGADQSVGWARVDVLDFPVQIEPPVAALDVAYLRSGGMTTVDPLANDSDPDNLVLAVQSVEVPEGSGLHAAVVDHHLVEVSADRTLTEPLVFTYTVSNGTASAVGSIEVVPVPTSASNQPPVVADREVSVRAGGVVTVSVLDGAYDPDGDTVVLDPELSELASDDGLLFVSGDVLRYKAPDTERTVTATFQVSDASGATSSALLTVHVRRSEAQTKPAPAPVDLVARVYSGEQVRIPVPLTGIDADGDGVTLLGLGDVAPQHGSVVQVGPDYLVYEALATDIGTDTFSYAVEDWTGQRAVATVQVGIVPRPSDAAAVVARDDQATVPPGATVEVGVLSNDVDSGGDPLTLDPTLVVSGEGAGDETAQVVDGFVVVRAPESETVLQIQYTARDARGGQDSAVLTVVVAQDAPVLPPVAKDVVVPAIDTIGRTQVDVDVLAVASNPSGPLSELDVAVPDVAAAVAQVTADLRVQVTLTDEPQIIPYRLSNTRDPSATAYAFITVPALGFFPPQLRPKAPEIRVGSGEQVTIELVEQIQVSPGRTPSLADEAQVRATKGTAEAASSHAVTFTADGDYAGPASVTVKVTDETGPGDEDARQATLTIPVTVYSLDERPPTFLATTVQVGQGDPPVVIDLAAFMKDGEGQAADPDAYTFTRTGSVPAGFTASLSGAELTVQAGTATSKGTTGQLSLSVGYGTSGSLDVLVPLRVVASTKPLARVLDQTRTDGRAGESYPVDVLADAYNPFAPDGALTVVGAVVETAGSGTATVSGSTVTLRPSDTFVGDMVVRFTVRDATGDPDREVQGRITLRVVGVPDAPTAPRLQDVGDRKVVLTWTAPDGRGAPITAYRVTVSDGTTRTCPTTTCTVDALENGTGYTFTVAAQNLAGWSDESPVSATVETAAVPDPADAPHLTASNGEIRATWTAPKSNGSAIQSYEVQISPAPDDPGSPAVIESTTTSARFTGLTNGTSYQVRVRAYNALPQPGMWSDWSSPATPATIPAAPGGFTASRVATNAGGQIELHWAAPSGNGAPLGAYVLQIDGGGASRTVHPAASDTSWVMTDADNGVAYTFTLRATNAMGQSAPVTATASTYGVPAIPVVQQVVGAAGGPYGQGTATVAWGAVENNGSPVTSYQVRANGVTIDAGTATWLTLTSLPGGQAVQAQVQACNAGGCSAWSSSVTSSPVPSTVPGTVQGLTVGVDTNQDGSPTRVNASWSAPDWAGESNGHAYQVALLVDGAVVSSFSTTQTSVQLVNGLPTLSAGHPSATLTVSVAAVSALGTGEAQTGSQTVSLSSGPADVTGLDAFAGHHDSINAVWNPVAGADHYEWVLLQNGTQIGSGTTTSTGPQTLTHRGFAASDVMILQVRAVDSSGRTSAHWASDQFNP